MKTSATYRDTTVGRVKISRSTAAQIVRGWRAMGLKVSYRGEHGGRFAFFGVDANHYIERL